MLLSELNDNQLISCPWALYSSQLMLHVFGKTDQMFQCLTLVVLRLQRFTAKWRSECTPF